MRSRALWLFIVLGILVLGTLGEAQLHPALAQDQAQSATPALPSGNPHANCLTCHSNPITVQYASGATDTIVFNHQQAVHNNLDCVVCHTDQATYPHADSGNNGNCSVCHWQKFGLPNAPSNPVFISNDQDKRAMILNMNNSCKKCHANEFTATTDSAHAKIMADGNRYAPVCVDCHGSHDIPQLNGSRSAIPQICSKCHTAEYTAYLSSVHGTALTQNNPDVPTCGDCHGIHKVVGPSDASFRPDSITVCGKCHSDKTLMSKYGISTDVFTTYLDSFHGRTVDFFRKSGEVKVPTATCYDCHGIHNIRKPDDPLSTVYPTNLQTTCSKCHGNASVRFPQAWLGHYEPTLKQTPALFITNQGYAIFVPTVIGGFVIYIALDARRRVANWFKERRARKALEETEDIADEQEESSK
jgi:hypothetical protein